MYKTTHYLQTSTQIIIDKGARGRLVRQRGSSLGHDVVVDHWHYMAIPIGQVVKTALYMILKESERITMCRVLWGV